MTERETAKELQRIHASRIRIALYFLELEKKEKAVEILEDVANSLCER